MKKSNFLAVLSIFTTLLVCSCSPSTSSSSSEFSYEPISGSSVSGYNFDLNEKYVLNDALSNTLGLIRVDSGKAIDKFKMLEEVVDINDFCINKVTTTTKKINHYGLFEDDTDFNDDNLEYDFTSTIIRNNNTHTLTGSSSEKTITKDINETVIGAYSLTYDEGYFYALETWDYDVKEDVSKTYVLSDEFVDKHLCLVNSKQAYSYFIEQLDDISFFDYQGIDLDTSIDYVEFTLSREKHFAQENITHSQNISLTFSNNGYVSGIEKTYCVYLGDKNENKILFLDSTKQILEII